MLSKWGGEILHNGSHQKKKLQQFTLFSACQLTQVPSHSEISRAGNTHGDPRLFLPLGEKTFTWEETNFPNIFKALNCFKNNRINTGKKENAVESSYKQENLKTDKSERMSSNYRHIQNYSEPDSHISGQEYFIFFR